MFNSNKITHKNTISDNIYYDVNFDSFRNNFLDILNYRQNFYILNI